MFGMSEVPLYSQLSVGYGAGWRIRAPTPTARRYPPALEATQGQMDGFFSQLPYTCHLGQVASVGDRLKFCPELGSRVAYKSIRMAEKQKAFRSFKKFGPLRCPKSQPN